MPLSTSSNDATSNEVTYEIHNLPFTVCPSSSFDNQLIVADNSVLQSDELPFNYCDKPNSERMLQNQDISRDDSHDDDSDYIVTSNARTDTDSDNNNELICVATTEKEEAANENRGNTAEEEVSQNNTEIPQTITRNDIIDEKTKKRRLNVSNWAKNIKKQKVNSGHAYVTLSGRERPSKSIGRPCNDRCNFKCSLGFDATKRELLFKSFYKLADKQKQREYIGKCMTPLTPTKRRKQNSKRKPNFAYFLPDQGRRVRVCKTFFVSTLAISNNTIDTVIKKTDERGFLEEEKRGKHSSHKTTSEDEVQGIKDHINSFPRIESHYCRAGTSKEYIEGSLNISTMYKLYTEKCLEENDQAVKFSIYRKIFSEEFNIGFFKPKKDLCSSCEAYKNSSQEEKETKKDAFEVHIQEKQLARKEKDMDKNMVSPEDRIVCSYDLQAVIPLPNGNVSTFYYKSKLNVYNFTIFDIHNKQGYSYIWNETIAKRGADEISTCVFDFLNQHCIGKDVVFYSDNCAAQNKNKFLISMYAYCVKRFNIKSISHKYLTIGHTENEGDSMHSCIERETKRVMRNGPIYIPAEFTTIVKSSKKTGRPFIVKELQTSDIMDWKKLSNEIGKNYNLNSVGEKVVWNEVKEFKVLKENPTTIQYRTSYRDREYKLIDITMRMRKKNEEITLQPAYVESPTIPINKKLDLTSLCDGNYIPKAHHNFFKNLK